MAYTNPHDTNPLRTNPRTNFDQLSPDVLLDLYEAASVLGVSHWTLKAWRYHGEGPQAVKMGRSVRYGVGDLRAWLSERRKAA